MSRDDGARRADRGIALASGDLTEGSVRELVELINDPNTAVPEAIAHALLRRQTLDALRALSLTVAAADESAIDRMSDVVLTFPRSNEELTFLQTNIAWIDVNFLSDESEGARLISRWIDPWPATASI